jgi:hypothetical protein
MAKDYRHGIDWNAAVQGVPIGEPIDAELDLCDPELLEEVLSYFVGDLENGTTLAWEAVIRDEQELPLSKAHKRALDELIDFSDGTEEDILYIDERARPPEPWYETLRRIAPALLVEGFDTTEFEFDAATVGWPRIVEAFEEHGHHISLPEGVTNAVDVIPLGLQHRLWLQACCEPLAGIGVEDLTDDERAEAIDEFIDALRECKEDVRALDLTVAKLLEILLIPPRERKVFVNALSKVLGLCSDTDPIADHL